MSEVSPKDTRKRTFTGASVASNGEAKSTTSASPVSEVRGRGLPSWTKCKRPDLASDGGSTPILLLEAALDSPSFRAHVATLIEQLNSFERWLDSTLKLQRDILNHLQSMEEISIKLFGLSSTNALPDTLIDHDYTQFTLERFSEGMRLFWSQIFAKGKEAQRSVTERLTLLQRQDLPAIYRYTREYTQQQDRYEQAVLRYLSQSRAKEPSALREDAFQLHDLRSGYLQACMEVVIQLSLFQAKLDKTLVESYAIFFKSHANLAPDTAKALQAISVNLDDGVRWSRKISGETDMLERFLGDAKSGVEKKTLQFWSPSRDLADYISPGEQNSPKKGAAVRKIRDALFGGKLDSEIPHKQGWLLCRITVSKPARYNWARRWCFIGQGSFGWLLNSIKGTAVEESERVGVLLCSIKHPTNEDRPFVFELKTRNASTLLQCESSQELHEWITTFEESKSAIMRSDTEQSNAFAVVQSQIPEFASQSLLLEDSSRGNNLAAMDLSTPRNSVEGQLAKSVTPERRNTRAVTQPVPSGIAAIVTAGHTALAQHPAFVSPISGAKPQEPAHHVGPPLPNLAPSFLAPPPIATQLSSKTLDQRISRNENILDKIPSAALANYWGCNLWIEPESTESDDSSEHRDQPDSISSSPTSLIKDSQNAPGNVVQFPTTYPNQLRRHSAQLLTLFPREHPENYVLMVSRALWRLDDEYVFGRLYATRFAIFLYAFNYGLISMAKITFVRVSAVEFDSSEQKVVVMLKDNEKIDLYLYLDNPNLVCRRLQVLHENSLMQYMSSSGELFEELKQMEPEKSGEVNEYSHTRNASTLSRRSLEHPTEEQSINAAIDNPQNIRWPSEPVVWQPSDPPSNLFFAQEFQISAKGLFHLTFGDRSPVWPRMLRRFACTDIEQGLWGEHQKTKERREWNYSIEVVDNLNRKRTSRCTCYQTIDVREEYLCYVVSVNIKAWDLNIPDKVMLQLRICITCVDQQKCRLTVWNGVNWRSVSKIIKGIVRRRLQSRVDDLSSTFCKLVINEMNVFGRMNPPSRAVNIYGYVGKLDTPTQHKNPRKSSIREPPTRPRGAIDIFQEDKMGTIERLIEDVSKFPIARTKRFAKKHLHVNRVFIIILLFSIFLNMALFWVDVGKLWNNFTAQRLARQEVFGHNGVMAKAIYLQDLEDMVANKSLSIFESASQNDQCLSKFSDLFQSVNWLDDSQVYPVLGDLRTTRRHFGTLRHDLLVTLRSINSMENMALQESYVQWREEEVFRCDELFRLYGIEAVGVDIIEYCRSCGSSVTF